MLNAMITSATGNVTILMAWLPKTPLRATTPTPTAHAAGNLGWTASVFQAAYALIHMQPTLAPFSMLAAVPTLLIKMKPAQATASRV